MNALDYMNDPDVSTLSCVKEFHDACDIPTPSAPGIPEPPDRTVRSELQFAAYNLRIAERALKGSGITAMPVRRAALLIEELRELIDAMAVRDPVAALDALCDLRYVADGTTLELGLAGCFDEGFAAVHRSNMAKVGPDGKVTRAPNGKVLKPEGWTPPDLASIVARAQGVESEESK